MVLPSDETYQRAGPQIEWEILRRGAISVKGASLIDCARLEKSSTTYETMTTTPCLPYFPAQCFLSVANSSMHGCLRGIFEDDTSHQRLMETGNRGGRGIAASYQIFGDDDRGPIVPTTGDIPEARMRNKHSHDDAEQE